METLPYQKCPTPPMTEAMREACARAIHVITRDGEVLRAGRAALFVLRALGYRKTAWCLRRPPFVWFVELGYWIVARNRGFFGRFLFRTPADDGRADGDG